MTKEFYNRMLLMSSLCLLSFSGPVSAQCVTPPTCSELGYTKSAADCEGHTFLKCPFNQTVGYCDLGTSSGNTAISCPTGYFLYNDIYPSCNSPNQTELVQYSYSSSDPAEYKDKKYKDCYKCKKCSAGFWFNAGTCWNSSRDSSGCVRCGKCSAVETLTDDGRCI